MNTHEAVLSPAGAARREAILDRARVALVARRRRRAVTRAAAAVVPVVAVVAAVWLFAGGARPRTVLTHGSVPKAEAGSATTPAAEGGLRRVAFEQVATQRGLAERLAASTRTASIEVLDDDELLDALRAAGRPTGLIRQAGTVVTTARVADNAPEGTEEPHEVGAPGTGPGEHG